jgi:Mg2+/Co2+ transporter CorC
MSFCDHCQGQRFDRAQVLRVLRDTRRRLLDSQNSKTVEHALALAIDSVRRLEIPHLDTDDVDLSDASIH